ncbi:unnamed protein product [Amoebophrya sp. A25]|nr:unnamed protein product [Amoebophrya sp. A25]|eukprot:GSA25T00012579001.1
MRGRGRLPLNDDFSLDRRHWQRQRGNDTSNYRNSMHVGGNSEPTVQRPWGPPPRAALFGPSDAGKVFAGQVYMVRNFKEFWGYIKPHPWKPKQEVSKRHRVFFTLRDSIGRLPQKGDEVKFELAFDEPAADEIERESKRVWDDAFGERKTSLGKPRAIKVTGGTGMSVVETIKLNVWDEILFEQEAATTRNVNEWGEMEEKVAANDGNLGLEESTRPTRNDAMEDSCNEEMQATPSSTGDFSADVRTGGRSILEENFSAVGENRTTSSTSMTQGEGRVSAPLLDENTTTSQSLMGVAQGVEQSQRKEGPLSAEERIRKVLEERRKQAILEEERRQADLNARISSWLPGYAP